MCAAQYQEKAAFIVWQTIKSRHGIEHEGRRHITKYGSMADGDGSAVKGMPKNHLMMTMGKDLGALFATCHQNTLLLILNATHATVE